MSTLKEPKEDNFFIVQCFQLEVTCVQQKCLESRTISDIYTGLIGQYGVLFISYFFLFSTFLVKSTFRTFLQKVFFCTIKKSVEV